MSSCAATLNRCLVSATTPPCSSAFTPGQKPVTCTGFTLKYDFKNGHIDGFVDETLRTVISGGKLNLRGGQTVIGGQTEGILLGGCLSLFRNLCGTPFYPDLTDAVLLIEDVGEKTYKIDLMLQQLTLCPGFERIKGIVFGEFADAEIADPEDGSIDDVIAEFCRNIKSRSLKTSLTDTSRRGRLCPSGRLFV